MLTLPGSHTEASHTPQVLTPPESYIEVLTPGVLTPRVLTLLSFYTSDLDMPLSPLL